VKAIVEIFPLLVDRLGDWQVYQGTPIPRLPGMNISLTACTLATAKSTAQAQTNIMALTCWYAQRNALQHWGIGPKAKVHILELHIIPAHIHKDCASGSNNLSSAEH